MAEHGIDVRVPFVGRQEHIERALALLPSGGIVTLAGPGGCGKSRLALEIAGRFGSGEFSFVPLFEVTDGAVNDALASALESRESPGESALDGVLARLRDRPRPILLDNAEHVLEEARAAAQAVASLGIPVIVTSRRRLGVPQESVIDVGPMSPEEAREFFTLCVRTRLADFAPNARDDSSIAKIVEMLDGLPFAIDLASARYPANSLSQLVEMTRRIVPSQLAGTSSTNSRHWALQRTIDWSTSLLSPRARAALGFLTLFNGRFDREDARAVCAPDESVEAVDAMLAELADHSLLVRMSDDSFGMLAPIRAAARQLLSGMQDRRAAAARFASRMRDIANAMRHRIELHDGFDFLPAIAYRYGDFRAVLEWSLKNAERLTIGAEIAWMLGARWVDGGHLSEGLTWTKRLTDAAEDAGTLESYVLARLWYTRLRLCNAAADYAALLEHAPFLISAFTQANDRLALGRGYNAMGVASLYLGDLENATTHAETALKLHRAIGHRTGIGAALTNLGSIALELGGDPARALALYTEAGEYVRGESSGVLFATLLGNRAEALYALGRFAESAQVAQQSLVASTSLGNVPYQAWCHQTLGRIHLSMGDPQAARAVLTQALDELEITPQPEYLAAVCEAAGRYALETGNAAEAVRLVRAAERYRERFRLLMYGPAIDEARGTAERARQALQPDAWEAAARAGDRLPPAELRSLARHALLGQPELAHATPREVGAGTSGA